MKKKIFSVIALVAGLVSCTGDYTNWASPQSNQENPTAEALAFAVQPTISSIDFATETSEDIQLFTSNLATSEFAVELSGEGSENKATITASSDGKVKTSDLATAVATVYGGESVERTLDVTVSGSFKFDTADGSVIVPKKADPFTLKAKLSSGAKIDSEPTLYLTGSNYGWGNPWVPLIPVNGDDETSWIIIYLHEGEEFKFAPQAGWGNDFGMSATIIDEAGMKPNGTDNIVVGNSGWYLIKVINKEGAREVKFMKPNIYLMGDTAPDGWEIKDSGLFAIPESETGTFVSPAFVKDAEVRMCVKFDDIDWWKTEFIVNAQGQIDYRAGGGDQERVNVKAGQKCYLNFSNGSGIYK